MKKILSFLFSRMVVVGMLILIQALILISLVWKLSNHFVYIYGIFILLSTIMVLWIVNKDDNPSIKLSWTIVIMVFPVFGGLFYVLFGNSRITTRVRCKMDEMFELSKKYYDNDEEIIEEVCKLDRRIGSQAKYIKNSTAMPLYKNTEVEYYPLGEIMFESMKSELEKAEKFIFMEYFIIEEGKMWNEILDILQRKVKAGVDVRVLYDDGGSLLTLPYGYEKKLKAMGIKCAKFNPCKPVLATALQNRDHRKITVIDGYTGFNGGINLADEYINEYPKHGHWKDCGIMLKGEAVFSLTTMFLESWNIYEPTNDNYEALKPKANYSGEFKSDGYIQPFGDSPLDKEYVGETVYLNIINQATDYVYINSPYLIVDNELITGLCMAAKRGVDVRIVVPHKGEDVIRLMTESYYKELVEDGVKIYEYTPGYIHSKTFLADDEIAVVGTINMDYRSLYHNYECATWMYKSKVVEQLKKDYVETLEVCQQITVETCINVPVYKRIIRGIMKLIAPLM